MPKSKNDPYKRKCAQALNHMAAAILDVNDVYTTFDEQAKTLIKVAEGSNQPKDKANMERYQRYVQDLKTVMMGTAAVREHLLIFIGEIWNLDEDSVKVYLG